MAEKSLNQFHEELWEKNLGPLWEAIPQIISKEPKPKAVPYLWKWRLIYDKIMESGQLITPERGGERRVLYFQNPGMKHLQPWGWGSTSNSLYAGVQLILPGEKAPAHRHNQQAIRYVIQGSGAYTAVDGERVYMEPGDFLITPAGSWHDHVHEGDEPMLWMDCLDIPINHFLGVSFFEHHEEFNQPITVPDNYSIDQYAGGIVRPVKDKNNRTAPLKSFKWERTKEALDGLSRHEPDPHLGCAVDYINPVTGGSACFTIGTRMQKLPEGFQGTARRQVSSNIFHVHRGKGYTVINGTRFDWEKGDFFVVPNWHWHEHVNTGSEEAFLFSTNDIPIMEMLRYQKEEDYEPNGGHQEIKGVFQPEL